MSKFEQKLTSATFLVKDPATEPHKLCCRGYQGRTHGGKWGDENNWWHRPPQSHYSKYTCGRSRYHYVPFLSGSRCISESIILEIKKLMQYVESYYTVQHPFTSIDNLFIYYLILYRLQWNRLFQQIQRKMSQWLLNYQQLQFNIEIILVISNTVPILWDV